MTQPTLQINTPYPPALEQTLRLALEQGLVSDKAQARAAGLTAAAIANRWERIADSLHLAYGHRHRAEVVVELFRHRAVEYLMLALCLYTTASDQGLDFARPRPPARAPVATVRPPASGQPRHGLLGVDWSVAA